MENQGAGVAEAGRRKGLKISCDPLETLEVSGNTGAADPGENAANQPGLETSPQVMEHSPRYQRFLREGEDAINAAAAAAVAEVDRRLEDALLTAGRSALGMPGTVDTFNAWLAEAGLALVLVPARRG
jgi:hypothetical protein